MVAEERGLIVAAQSTDLVPQMVMSLEQAKANYNQLKGFVSSLMVKNEDYGVIPGADKPTLLKPGAEKLLNIYGYVPTFDILEKVEDWQGGFFYYQVRCTVLSKRTGGVIATAIGSCNSKENRYSDRWVMSWKVPPGMDKSKLETREFTSKDHKKYTQYKIPNPDLYSQVNTILKMAEKRAFVAATLHATAASDTFTQDMEDLTPEPIAPQAKTEAPTEAPIEGEWSPVPEEAIKEAQSIPETIFNESDDEPTRIAKGKAYLDKAQNPFLPGQFKNWEDRCSQVFVAATDLGLEPTSVKDWYSKEMLTDWLKEWTGRIAAKDPNNPVLKKKGDKA